MSEELKATITFETYEALLEYIQVPREDYYEVLLLNSDIILRAYHKRTQSQIGQELGMSQSQASLLLKLLLAYSDLNHS